MREVRKIPVNMEAEAALLGALLLDNEAIHRLKDLDAGAFHGKLHAEVWSAIRDLAAKGKPFDPVSVHIELGTRGSDAQLLEINELAQYVPSAANIRRYAEIVQNLYRSRQLMEAGSAIADLAMNPGTTAAEQIDKAQMVLAKLATVRAKRDPEHILESLDKFLALLQDRVDGRNPAIRTGIDGLDKLLNGGLQRGELMVIGARPKHGKTALALALARNMAREHSVLFLSQEMPISQLLERHTAAIGSVDLGLVMNPNANDGEMWPFVTEAARSLRELHLNHDGETSLSLMDIRRKAIKVKRERGLDVLFVDFLQLMSGAGEENRNRELDVIVNGIKALAMDMQIAVIVLSQLSREADKYYGRPLASHLKDSGAIEAAADRVAMLFTDWAHPMSKRQPDFQGFSQLEVVLSRSGPQGLIPLEFVGRYQQMGDWMRPIPTHLQAAGRGSNL